LEWPAQIFYFTEKTAPFMAVLAAHGIAACRESIGSLFWSDAKERWVTEETEVGK
jgi:hypothetical protein